MLASHSAPDAASVKELKKKLHHQLIIDKRLNIDLKEARIDRAVRSNNRKKRDSDEVQRS